MGSNTNDDNKYKQNPNQPHIHAFGASGGMSKENKYKEKTSLQKHYIKVYSCTLCDSFLQVYCNTYLEWIKFFIIFVWLIPP